MGVCILEKCQLQCKTLLLKIECGVAQEHEECLSSRHAAVLVETIKKGIHDADAEARVEARK